MTALGLKFAAMAALMVGAMAAGYAARRLRWLREEVGESLMTFVAVFGYPLVGFFSIWGTPLRRADLLLPVMGVSHMVGMTWLSWLLARAWVPDRAERGLFAIAGGLGNNGFTMGAFVIYLLYGEEGMGLANLYFMAFLPAVVLLMYPLALHHANHRPAGSLGTLIGRSLLDWRALGLPVSLAAIALSLGGWERPQILIEWRVIDGLVYTTTPLAFFGIGLRLHGSKIRPLWRMVAGLGLVRFGLGAMVAAALAWLSRLTPWPLDGMRWNVCVVEGFVPTAVTMVAIANMFDLRPREASVLFVLNTLLYLVFVLPVVLLLFGG